MCLLLFFLQYNLCCVLTNLLWVWIILFERVLITQHYGELKCNSDVGKRGFPSHAASGSIFRNCSRGFVGINHGFKLQLWLQLGLLCIKPENLYVAKKQSRFDHNCNRGAVACNPNCGVGPLFKTIGPCFASYLSISSFFHEELIMAAILVMEIVLEQVSWNVIHCQWFRPFVLPIIHYQSLRNRWLNCVMRFLAITNFRNFSHISRG